MSDMGDPQLGEDPAPPMTTEQLLLTGSYIQTQVLLGLVSKNKLDRAKAKADLEVLAESLEERMAELEGG